MGSSDSPSLGRTTAKGERGVVWLRSGTSAPAGLLNALASRGLRVTVVVDAAAALREVIRGGVACLVLHEAARLPRMTELLDTLERYYPAVRTMQFGDGERPDSRLAVLGSVEANGPSSATSRPTEPGHHDEAPDDPALAARVTVSEAELAMLLGPVEDEEDEPSAEGNAR
ncbi:MAG: hypothetical protein AAGE65_03225 [Planctomycetota bacterium]